MYVYHFLHQLCYEVSMFYVLCMYQFLCSMYVYHFLHRLCSEVSMFYVYVSVSTEVLN
jgi:hypothetical protein